ncbi:hypothetical protein PINS_up013825 [Pythium insidiosum]|nr:hypothetical protein PINS_up013825 [Pythium insidiosum]
MEKQLDNYVIQKRLAPALFGDVLLCEHRPTGDRVAVKRVLLSAAAEKKTIASKKRVRENVAFERELYHKFRAFGNHRNVLALRDEIEFDGYLYMIFDFCARGELYEIVSGAADGKLDLSTTRDYLTQIASGVHFMHSNGFAHRDLSLENVLVTDDNTCKVCDFGLARCRRPALERDGWQDVLHGAGSSLWLKLRPQEGRRVVARRDVVHHALWCPAS